MHGPWGHTSGPWWLQGHNCPGWRHLLVSSSEIGWWALLPQGDEGSGQKQGPSLGFLGCQEGVRGPARNPEGVPKGDKPALAESRRGAPRKETLSPVSPLETLPATCVWDS